MPFYSNPFGFCLFLVSYVNYQKKMNLYNGKLTLDVELKCLKQLKTQQRLSRVTESLNPFWIKIYSVKKYITT